MPDSEEPVRHCPNCGRRVAGIVIGPYCSDHCQIAHETNTSSPQTHQEPS